MSIFSNWKTKKRNKEQLNTFTSMISKMGRYERAAILTFSIEVFEKLTDKGFVSPTVFVDGTDTVSTLMSLLSLRSAAFKTNNLLESIGLDFWVFSLRGKLYHLFEDEPAVKELWSSTLYRNEHMIELLPVGIYELFLEA